MIRQWLSVSIGGYDETVSVDTLRRHQAWARRITRTWAAAGLLMISSFVEFLLSDPGVLRTASMAILLAAGAVSFVFALPAVVTLGLWSGDIDRALIRAGLPAGFHQQLARDTGIAAMKICVYVALLLAIPQLL